MGIRARFPQAFPQIPGNFSQLFHNISLSEPNGETRIPAGSQTASVSRAERLLKREKDAPQVFFFEETLKK